MAVKTITIDLEAYEILSKLKKKGQSFSQVVKEHLPKSKTGADLRAALAGVSLSSETLDALDGLLERRREDTARVPRL
jgi:predicted CopG family antitoxin